MTTAWDAAANTRWFIVRWTATVVPGRAPHRLSAPQVRRAGRRSHNFI